MEEKTIDEQVKTCSEVELYFIVDECGAFIWRMNHELAHGRIEDPRGNIGKDIVKMREIQQKAVEQTPRFGVPFKMEDGRACDEYWKWYKFWDSWKKELSNEDWNSVCSLMKEKKSYDEYLPKVKWNDVV